VVMLEATLTGVLGENPVLLLLRLVMLMLSAPPLPLPLLPLTMEKVSRVGVRRSMVDLDMLLSSFVFFPGSGGDWNMLGTGSLALAVRTESNVSSLLPDRTLGAAALDLLGVVGVFWALGSGAAWYIEGGLWLRRGRFSLLVFPLELEDDLTDAANKRNEKSGLVMI
jgi:hypothetical protein